MFHQSNQIETKKSLFVTTGTYQTPVLRGWRTNYSANSVDEYLRATESGTNINPVTMSYAVGSMLAPSTAPDTKISIANGWQTERMSFIIELDFIQAMGKETVVVTGYTDAADLSYGGTSFDPNMRLYFSTTSVLQTNILRTPHGEEYTRSLVDTSHLLSPVVAAGVLNQTQNLQPYHVHDLQNMSPHNVIRRIQTNTMDLFNTDGTTDIRTQLNNADTVKSSRLNAVATSYASNILKNVTSKYNEIDAGLCADEHEALNQAIGLTKPMDAIKDPFILALYRRTGFRSNGYVTWKEMQEIVPDIDMKTVFTPRRTAQRGITVNIDAQAGNFQSWDAINKETVVAQYLAQAIPGLMAASLLGSVSFFFTNDGQGVLQPKVEIVGGFTFIEGLPVQVRAEIFKNKFLSEIAPYITDYGRTLVTLAVNASLGTDTFISISRDGGPEVPYCVPTFADHLFVPTIAMNTSIISEVASDFNNFIRSVHTSPYSMTYN